jgi:hypothetical protein
LAKFAEADVVEQFSGALIVLISTLFRAPEVERRSMLALQCNTDIGPAPSDAGTPPRSGTSAPGQGAPLGGRRRGDVLALVDDLHPADGCMNLVSRLKHVVLPAPLGPINA